MVWITFIAVSSAIIAAGFLPYMRQHFQQQSDNVLAATGATKRYKFSSETLSKYKISHYLNML